MAYGPSTTCAVLCSLLFYRQVLRVCLLYRGVPPALFGALSRTHRDVMDSFVHVMFSGFYQDVGDVSRQRVMDGFVRHGAFQ
jgi:hypothetical protein